MGIYQSRLLTCSIYAMLLSPRAYAITSTLPAPHFALRTLVEDYNLIEVHPFGNKAKLTSTLQLLLPKSELGFVNQVEKFLRSGYVHPLISTHYQSESQSFNLANVAYTFREIRFGLGGTEFCGFQLKALEFADGDVAFFGLVPKLDDFGAYAAPEPDDWPRLEDAHARAADQLNIGVDAEDLEPVSSRRCLIIRDLMPVPVWDMVVRLDGLAYRVYADQYEAYQTMRLYFDATAAVSAYTKNPVDTKIEAYNVAVNGDGYLNNSFFTTSPAGQDRAYAEDHVFNYDPSDARFTEGNAYAHANQIHDWFQGMGYQWIGPQPLTLKLHAVFSGNNYNNALYQPADASTSNAPSISIGDGDGVQLRNLPLDRDVVSHEFGHHIIFRSVKQTSGESLVLHEGMADFFTFAYSGDNCLAESICPATSQACVVPGQCLRTAETSMKYTDANFAFYPDHIKGQAVSGMLWDLHSKQGLNLADVASVAYHAIDSLSEAAGYRNLILGLMVADKALFAAKNACTIYQAAVDRGFAAFIADIDCHNTQQFEDACKQTSCGDAPAPPSSSKRKNGNGICGSIGEPAGHSTISLLLVWLIPVIFMTLQRRRQISKVSRDYSR